MTVSAILESARAQIVRVRPAEAHVEQRDGALLVDIRPAHQREIEGEIPGSLVLERNVLEWRLDPTGDARIPETHAGLRVIVVCSEGYASSLAAASLVDLGLAGATDLDGGFRRWRALGLPTVPGPTATGTYVSG
jgi:rhodanese-related sulfurtransferase